MFDAVQDQFHQFLATAATTTSRPNSTPLPPPPTTTIPNSNPFPLSNPFPFPIHHHHPHHVPPPTNTTTPYPINFHPDHHPFPPVPHDQLHHHHHHHQPMLLPSALHFLHQQQPPPLPLQLHHLHHQKIDRHKESIGLTTGGCLLSAANAALQERERTTSMPSAEAVVDHPWSSDEVLALLRIRSSMENWFPNLTWEHVSRKLADHGFKRSSEQCREKFEEESRYFNNMSTTNFAAPAATAANTASINCNKNNSYSRLFSDLEVEDIYHQQQQEDHHHHHHHDVILSHIPHHENDRHHETNPHHQHDHHNHNRPSVAAAPDHDDQISAYKQDEEKEEDIEVEKIQAVVVVEEEDKIGQTRSVGETAADHLAVAAATDKLEDHQSVDDIQGCSSGSHDHDRNNFDETIELKTKRPSTSSSASTRKRKRHHHRQDHKKFEMFKRFCERIMNQMISQQEELHNKILEDMVKRDEEKIAREEAWMKQEMDRINEEIKVRAQEQAIAGGRQAKIIEFLNKFTSQSPSNSTTTSPDDHNHDGNEILKVPNIPTTTVPASISIDKDPSTITPTHVPIPTSACMSMQIVHAQTNPSSLNTHYSSSSNMPTSPSTTDEMSKIPMSSSNIHDQPSRQNPNTNPMISTQDDPVPNIQQPLPPPLPPGPPPSTSANSIHKSQQIVSYNLTTNTSSSDRDTGKRWPRDEVLALINIRCSLYINVAGGGATNDPSDHDQGNNNLSSSSKAPLWERISQKMLELGYNRSAKRCKEKWENINKYFRKTKDSNKKRSVDSRTCPYFHQLNHLYSQGTLVVGSDNRAANPTSEFSESAGTGGSIGGGDGVDDSTLDADSDGDHRDHGAKTARGNLEF